MRALSSMLYGVHVYKHISLKNVKKIITQQDRYPFELAIIEKAKSLGIKTIKYDFFPFFYDLGYDTINCDYYFYANNITKRTFESSGKNDNVRFFETGFPFWDYYAEDTGEFPDNNEKIVTFCTQHGFEKGAFGPKGPSFYIEEIINALPDNYILYIKMHPLDNYKNYLKFESKKVKIVKHGEIDNRTIFKKSSFIFSIMSSVIYQAKHICPRSYFINYYPCEGANAGYEFVTEYIDLITNRAELEKVLLNKKAPKDQNTFIKFFNPNYPHTIHKMKELIKAL